MKKSISHIDIALFACVSVITIIASISYPYLNWDVIGYVGSVQKIRNIDTTSAQTATFAILNQQVPPQTFQQLTSGAYRIAVATDSTSFAETLPFYQTRPIYNYLVHLTSSAGLDLVSATHAVSGISVLCALALLFLMSRSMLPPASRLVIALSAIAFEFPNIARASTPDGLALLATIGCASLVLKNRFKTLVWVLPLLGLIRTDLGILSLVVLSSMMMNAQSSRVALTLSSVATVLVCEGLERHYGHPGWATVFYATLIEPLPHPLSQPATLTAAMYGEALLRGVRYLTEDVTFLLFVAITVSCGHLIRRASEGAPLASRQALQLTKICLAYMLLHFLMFPVSWPRFFAAPYMITTFSLLLILSRQKALTAERPVHAPDGQAINLS